MKHLLLALVHVGAEPTAGGPRFTFSLFVLLASLEGYARSTACLPPTPGFLGASAPLLLQDGSCCRLAKLLLRPQSGT